MLSALRRGLNAKLNAPLPGLTDCLLGRMLRMGISVVTKDFDILNVVWTLEEERGFASGEDKGPILTYAAHLIRGDKITGLLLDGLRDGFLLSAFTTGSALARIGGLEGDCALATEA